jgi:arabinofuranan 3-O-arabinosyltransferase
MHSPRKPAESAGAGGATTSRAVWRMRLFAVCIALAALGFLQDPGSIVIDTKVDLAVDPAGWLARSLHVWDPAGTFGQLQNQAYGYLWPMGSFFLAGKLLTIPAWVVQRLWWAVVMTVACTGVVKLAEKLGIGSPWTRLVAGVAFALSPRMITELGPISVEAWPSALAPWVLVPLAGLAQGVRLRKPIAYSALIVACAGGVNATAVLAVVPLAGIWLLGLRPFTLRIKALIAWGLAVGAATAWWVVPLLVLGRYSPPFLDYIETGATTTSVTDTTSVLRGASHWHAYLGGAFGAAWTAGWRIATEQPLIIASLVVAGLGIAGLARRGIPHRWFLVTGLLTGLALVGLGHVGDVPGLFADSQRAFLDGAGAPLRNVHKFDVVVRLPLILGLAHLLTVMARAAAAAPAPIARPAQLRAAVVTGTALVAVAGVAAPALGGGLAAQGSFESVPGYWQQASGWLNRNLDQEHVLVVPGSRFPRYLWGSPSDEITQPLLDKRWGVRSSIPLTPPETIRVLDAIEHTLTTGAGSAGLADYLARSGVRYLLLRSDLDYGRSGAVQPMIVKQALARSAGLRQVAGFGPHIGGERFPQVFVDNGMRTRVRALEIWEVRPAAEPVVAYDSSQLTTVVGGPESVLDTASAGVLPAGPTVLAGDRTEETADGPVVVTDGLRRKEVAFGLAHDSASATMQATDEPVLGAPARDYLPEWAEGNETTVRYRGIKTVYASSAFSQAQPLSGARPGYQPFAALDGDVTTSWRSAPGTIATEQWFEVMLPRARRIPKVNLTFDLGTDSLPSRITVVSAGNEAASADVFGENVEVALPVNQPTDRIRVYFDAVRDMRIGYGGVGIAEFTIPGVRAERTLVVPDSPVTTSAPSMVFTAAVATPACYFTDGLPACNSDLARLSEDGTSINRTTTLPVAARYDVTVKARPRPGAALNALLDGGGKASVTQGIPPIVTTSSVGVDEPAARPGAAVDGDIRTAWFASDTDPKPWIRLNWPAVQVLTGVKLTLDPATAASSATQVTVLTRGDNRSGYLDENGLLEFSPPVRSDELTLLVTDTSQATSYDPYRDVQKVLPVGIGEFSVVNAAAPERHSPTATLNLGCGSGPTVKINGVTRQTALIASRRDLVEMREVGTQVCGANARNPVAVAAGETRVVATASPVATPSQVALTPDRPATASGGQAGGSPVLDDTVSGSELTGVRTPVTVGTWEATLRRVSLEAYPNQRVLALRENINPGWAASLDGVKLPTLVVDGWQQAWLVPAGAQGEIEMRFEPDQVYGTAISTGALLVTAVGVLAVLPSRRRNGSAVALVPARRPRRRTLLPVLFGGIALLAFGGVAAAGVIALGAAAMLAFRTVQPWFGEYDRRRLRQVERLAGWLLPVVFFAAAGYFTVSSAGHTAALPQLAAVAAVALLWLSVVLRRGGRGQRWLKR